MASGLLSSLEMKNRYIPLVLLFSMALSLSACPGGSPGVPTKKLDSSSTTQKYDGATIQKYDGAQQNQYLETGVKREASTVNPTTDGSISPSGDGGYVPPLSDAAAANMLTNVGTCSEPLNRIFPSPGSEGMLVAVRLVPSAYPYQVTGVRYRVSDDQRCTSQVAHRVELYVSKNAAPDSTPTPAAVINVPASGAPITSGVILQSLSSPIALQQGESLFIAIQLAGDGGSKTLCVSTCPENEKIDRNYWSGTLAPPYSWVTLSSLNIHVNLFVEALGQP
jgi:hypothetical protein